MTQVIALVFPALVAYAAVSDLFTMKIPNWLTGSLALAFPVTALLVGLDFSSTLNHGAAGFLLLVAGMAMFAPGWMGGGDAKLLAAIALWFGLSQALVDFLLLTAVGGGALTLLLLTMRSMPLPRFTLSWDWLQRLHDKKSGIPFGIAIAGAALAAYPGTGIWKSLIVIAG